MKIVATRVLTQRTCTSIIRNARRRLDNNERYRTDHLSYQRQLVTLDTGDKATGVLCYHCRELIKIGNQYVKKGSKSAPEYPPINGGVGRYTYNLVNELKRQGLDVYVACDNKGNGDYAGLSPNNMHNSEILLNLVNKIKPDIVHIQYEPGLYGLTLPSIRPNSIHSTIDFLYDKCKTPIVTTFHSEYEFRQWMRIPQIKINKRESLSISEKSTDDEKYRLLSSLKNRLVNINIYWKYLINYKAFRNQNKEKLLKSDAGIVFSDYVKTIIGTNKLKRFSSGKMKLLYHAAEPAAPIAGISKKDARLKLLRLIKSLCQLPNALQIQFRHPCNCQSAGSFHDIELTVIKTHMP
jgi:glycosyltransferase involved in cell wall biosynthesis